MTCLAHGVFLFSAHAPSLQGPSLKPLLQARSLDASLSRLVTRDALPTNLRASPHRGHHSKNVPPRPGSAPPHLPQSAPTAPSEHLHRLKSAPVGIVLTPPVSPGSSRHVSPARARTDRARDQLELSLQRLAVGFKPKADMLRIQNQPQHRPNEKQASSARGRDEIRTQTATMNPSKYESAKPTQAQLSERLMHDSGATSSRPNIVGQSPRETSARSPPLSKANEARLIEHDEWLKDTKAAISRAENYATKMNKMAKRREKKPIHQMVDAASKADKFKADSKQARATAKGALLDAEKLLDTIPAGGEQAISCLNAADHKVRASCVVGAMHAKMEREAAKTASQNEYWNLAINHVKGSAKAMTRARAFEAQGNAWLAQHDLKGLRKSANALAIDNPRRKKADDKVELALSDYTNKAAFYSKVHDNYHQTRGDFAGSESEDEKWFFPLIDPK